ncbi:hypothetical protein D3C71_1173600 [compost metagenome]
MPQQPPAGFEGPCRQLPRPAPGAGQHRLQCGAQQRQRHHHQAPPRDRQQVDQRPGARSLPKQRHGQRQQRKRGHALRPQERAQPVHLLPRQAPDQPQHAGKAEPEPRGKQRQRICQQHGQGGQRQRLAHCRRPARAARRAHHRDHQHRPHRGQGEPGHCCIQRRAQHGRHGRRQWPGQATPEGRPQPPAERGQPRRAAGDQADVKAGDRNQVGQAQRTQIVPVGLAQPARVAQRERLHEARPAPAHLRADRLGHAFTPGRQPLGRPQRAGTGRVTYVARAGQPLQDRLPFAVEAARVTQAPRWPQAHGQLPARAGADMPARVGGVARLAMPAHHECAPSQRDRQGRIVVHLEQEAAAARAMHRQVGHPAPHDVLGHAAGCRQLQGKGQVRVQRRPAQSG